MMVYYKDRWYEIVRVDPFEDYKDDIKLYSKEALGTSVPDKGQVVEYE